MEHLCRRLIILPLSMSGVNKYLVCKYLFVKNGLLKTANIATSTSFNRFKHSKNLSDYISEDTFKTTDISQQKLNDSVDDLDFYGIENDSGVINIEPSSSKESVVETFEKRRVANLKKDFEMIIPMTFGKVRIDTLNQPHYNRPYRRKSGKKHENIIGNSSENVNESENKTGNKDAAIKNDKGLESSVLKDDLSFIDKTYFESEIENDNYLKTESSKEQDSLSFIDESYFGHNQRNDFKTVSDENQNIIDQQYFSSIIKSFENISPTKFKEENNPIEKANPYVHDPESLQTSYSTYKPSVSQRQSLHAPVKNKFKKDEIGNLPAEVNTVSNSLPASISGNFENIFTEQTSINLSLKNKSLKKLEVNQKHLEDSKNDVNQNLATEADTDRIPLLSSIPGNFENVLTEQNLTNLSSEDKSLKKLKVKQRHSEDSKNAGNQNLDIDRNSLPPSISGNFENKFTNTNPINLSSNVKSLKKLKTNEKHLDNSLHVSKVTPSPMKDLKPSSQQSKANSPLNFTPRNKYTEGLIDESVDKLEFISEKVKPDIIADKENPKTAYDMAMKIRDEMKKKKQETANKGNTEAVNENAETATDEVHYDYPVDSQGWRILKDQVPQLHKMTKGEIVNLLKKSVVLNNFDIIAIDKPYGLPVLYGPKVQYCLMDLLPDLTKVLSKPTDPIKELFIVHRIDKCASGLLLLAKTKEMAHKLSLLFKEKRITKTYWAITKGIPYPREGLIDIPIAEGKIKNIRRMILQPERTEETRKVVPRTKRHSHKAITYYKVLDANNSCALVELCPETGVKHQLRVHLGFGLNCPILSDHKYSHYTKMAPQRLPKNVLIQLGVRQSKVRHLPMLLHSKILVVPEIVEGRNVFITRFLPHHFQVNMKRLKLKPPK